MNYNLSENELVKLFIENKDERAFTLLIKQYQQSIYWHCLRMLGNHSDADEVTQQVFITLYKKLYTYKFESKLSTWIFTIAMNQLRSNYRSLKGKETINLEDIENLSGGADTEACLEANETKTAILCLLNELDERQHSIITLKYYGGLSNKEISDIMKISETNVSTMLNRAIKKLRNILEKRDEFSDFAYKSQEGKR